MLNVFLVCVVWLSLLSAQKFQKRDKSTLLLILHLGILTFCLVMSLLFKPKYYYYNIFVNIFFLNLENSQISEISYCIFTATLNPGRLTHSIYSDNSHSLVIDARLPGSWVKVGQTLSLQKALIKESISGRKRGNITGKRKVRWKMWL